MGVIVVKDEADLSKYDKATLLDLYRSMVNMRTFDKNIIRLIAENKIVGFYHSGQGHEAIAAGTCSVQRDDDYMYYDHRGANGMIGKGVPLVNLYGDFLARECGTTRGLGAGIVHSAWPEKGVLGQSGTLGATFVIAPGTGYAIKYLGTDQVCTLYFGDGTSARETFHGGMNFAGLHKLPVIFVLENNEYAAMQHFKRDHSIKEYIAERAEGYCIPGYVVDGNDVLKVREVYKEAVDRARSGEGPTFIECKTFRHRGHFEGDPYHYADPEVIKLWKDTKDPIDNYRAKLINSGIATQEEFNAIDKIVAEENLAAIAEAEKSPLPPPERIYQGLFEEEVI
jgi:pyruvate dehydrogenase E1 component alpha subunit